MEFNKLFYKTCFSSFHWVKTACTIHVLYMHPYIHPNTHLCTPMFTLMHISMYTPVFLSQPQAIRSLGFKNLMSIKF